MNKGNTQANLNFVPFDTLKFQKHHSFPFGNLVLCDGSRNGKTIYKPRICAECQKWCGRCLKGRINRIASDSACSEAI